MPLRRLLDRRLGPALARRSRRARARGVELRRRCLGRRSRRSRGAEMISQYGGVEGRAIPRQHACLGRRRRRRRRGQQALAEGVRYAHQGQIVWGVEEWGLLQF